MSTDDELVAFIDSLPDAEELLQDLSALSGLPGAEPERVARAVSLVSRYTAAMPAGARLRASNGATTGGRRHASSDSPQPRPLRKRPLIAKSRRLRKAAPEQEGQR
jgi:hypothetical protein